MSGNKFTVEERIQAARICGEGKMRGMYTKRELKRAAGIIRQIARDNHVTEEEVRRDMKEAMDAGRSNPDPAVQAKWAGFEYSGDEPTLEEFILWMAGQIKESGD